MVWAVRTCFTRRRSSVRDRSVPLRINNLGRGFSAPLLIFGAGCHDTGGHSASARTTLAARRFGKSISSLPTRNDIQVGTRIAVSANPGRRGRKANSQIEIAAIVEAASASIDSAANLRSMSVQAVTSSDRFPTSSPRQAFLLDVSCQASCPLKSWKIANAAAFTRG